MSRYLLCLGVFIIGIAVGSITSKSRMSSTCGKSFGVGDRISVRYPTGDYVTDASGEDKQPCVRSTKLVVYRDSNNVSSGSQKDQVWTFNVGDTTYFAHTTDD